MKTNLSLQKINMTQQMKKMLMIMGVLLGLILAYHLISSTITKYHLEKEAETPITVSTAKVEFQDWQPHLFAIGNLFAANGIDVTSQVDGMISEIHIVSNQKVKKGQPLVQLDAAPELAALESLKAEAKLAKLTYERSKAQFAFNAISAEALENDEYSMLVLEAQVAEQEAIVDLKTIRAAFDGQIGISKLSPGQFISAGDPMISLQSLELLYVYFYLPEQNLSMIQVGQDVHLRADSFPDRVFPGKISAIDPLVNTSMHNIQLEATIENSKTELLPGLYTQIEIITGQPEKRLTIPQSVISYNPYGNYVYVVQKDGHEEEDKENHDEKHKQKHRQKGNFFVKQRFITVGETRGDQVTVLTGLQEGDEIVSSGQLKLRNNAGIVINNEIAPSNDAAPQVKDEQA